MIIPTLEEAKKLSPGNTVIPIALEVFSDRRTPVEVLRTIQRQSKDWYILESVSNSPSWGRYSFLGYQPVMTVKGTEHTITLKGRGTRIEKSGSPVDVIRDMIAGYKSPRIPYLPPFTGGFVGYFGYDFVRHFIPGLSLHAVDDSGFPEVYLMLMDKVIAFDHFKQKIYIIVNISVEDLEHNYRKGIAELKDIEAMILEPTSDLDEIAPVCGEFSPVFSEMKFQDMVRQVKHHIVEGDIFQCVISNRFQAPFQGSLMNAYRILRTTNPSPYMVYMCLEDMEIACSSPETLISLQDGEVSSYPLAGTCPHKENEAENNVLMEALLQNEKELAEHDMLVDLARNDLGKVSCFGSVSVREYRQVKQFSQVNHIASRVTGQLRDGIDAMDVIAATLPAGTLSGAPKKRACEIIDQLEGTRRGVYGGAIGYIDFTGNADLCIGIRMAVLKGGTVSVQAGAGIVADSVPEQESRETKIKSKAIIDALQRCGEV